jgi:hypothetical protein
MCGFVAVAVRDESRMRFQSDLPEGIFRRSLLISRGVYLKPSDVTSVRVDTLAVLQTRQRCQFDSWLRRQKIITLISRNGLTEAAEKSSQV